MHYWVEARNQSNQTALKYGFAKHEDSLASRVENAVTLLCAHGYSTVVCQRIVEGDLALEKSVHRQLRKRFGSPPSGNHSDGYSECYLGATTTDVLVALEEIDLSALPFGISKWVELAKKHGWAKAIEALTSAQKNLLNRDLESQREVHKANIVLNCVRAVALSLPLWPLALGFVASQLGSDPEESLLIGVYSFVLWPFPLIAYVASRNTAKTLAEYHADVIESLSTLELAESYLIRRKGEYGNNTGEQTLAAPEISEAKTTESKY